MVLGDGAPWIWGLAGEHFPGAIEVVDLYHAREHLHALGRLVLPALGADGPGWLAERLAELDRGDVEAGCRAVVAQRLKLSGMRWTVRGASAIVSLRCEGASGRWDDVWKRLHDQTTAA